MFRKYKKESKIYTKRQVVNSKTPMDFIHRCLYSKLSYSEKQQASKEWRERTGYTVDDIKYARHRHPYWKAKKKEGYEKRYIERTQKYTYPATLEW